MTSNWALPRNISQYAEEGAENLHIPWLDVGNFYSLKHLDGRSIRTSQDLVHIARDPRSDITQKTYFLKITNFNFLNLPATVSGIELRLTSNRSGRITDDTIQLILNDQPIGDNQADLNLDTKKIYGGQTEMWNTTNLTLANIQDSSFGILLRFKSHPRWPHKCSPFIDTVELRIH